MKIEIDLPNSIDDIKLKDYQEFLDFMNTTKDEQAIQLKMIQLFCNFDYDAITKIKASSLIDITNHINNIFEEEKKLTRIIKIGNKEFGFITNLEEITLGEYIDLDNYLGDFSNIHRAMAVLYRPIVKKKRAWFNRKEVQYSIEEYNGTEQSAELMKHMPLGVALGAQFFFVNLRIELLKSMINFLTQQMEEKKINKTLTDFLVSSNLDKNGDGIVQYISLLRQTLDNLTQSQDYNYINV